MMRRLLILTILLAGGPFVAQAILPQDAGFRKKEILEYRQRKLAEYEQAQQKHEALMINRDQEIRRVLASPPWGGSTASAAIPAVGTAHSTQKYTGARQYAHKWLFSIVALLFIGGGVWWVRISTESEQDK